MPVSYEIAFWAVRTDALHHQVVAEDLIAGPAGKGRVIFLVVGTVHILHMAAEDAPHMVVGVRPEVEAVTVGHDHPEDFLVVA